MYLGMTDLIEDLRLDFTGIKGQPELTTHFATADVAEALLNDPYDWNGPKAPHVCATEADMDGALTMQLLQSALRTPRSCSRTSGITTRTAGSGTSATPASTPPGSRRDPPTRPRIWVRSSSFRLSSTSRPAAPPSTT